MNLKLLLLALFFCSSAYTQSNYRKGYIIGIQGDTLKGYINYREQLRNPSAFFFKSLPEGKTAQEITVHNAQKVVVEGYKSFERFKVSISMNEKDYNRLEINANPPDRTDTVFLALVIKGDKAGLYSYRDKLKDRFYVVVPAQGEPTELLTKEEIQGNQVSTLRTYRKQLYQIAVNSHTSTPELARLIESASYSGTSLKRIVSKINTVNEKEFAAGMQSPRKGTFFAGAGLNVSSITYKGKNLINANGLDNNGGPAYKAQTKTTSVTPVISVGYDLFFRPSVRRSFLRTEIRVTAVRSETNSMYKFSPPYTEELTNRYKLRGIFLSLDPQFGYNLYNQHKLKIYATAGLSLRYSSYPSQTLYQTSNKQGPGYIGKVVEKYIRLRSLTAVPAASAGVLVNKKIFASFTWFNASELKDIHNLANESVKYRPVYINVGLVF